MTTSNFQSDKNGYELKAEQRIAYKHNGRSRRFVMDVLVRDNSGVSVIDWKTHSITNKDLQQVEIYQEYLLDSLGWPKPTRIFGFAVDLLHEEVIERHFRASKAHIGLCWSAAFEMLRKNSHCNRTKPYRTLRRQAILPSLLHLSIRHDLPELGNSSGDLP